MVAWIRVIVTDMWGLAVYVTRFRLTDWKWVQGKEKN